MKGPNVLIIDDEPKICEQVKKFLDTTNKFGNVVIAESVSMGLLKIRNEDFDLLIVDYKMPHKLGTEFFEIIKLDFRYAKIKTILMSGYIDHTAINVAMAAGLRNILVKPFNRSKLLDLVFKVLKMEYRN